MSAERENEPQALTRDSGATVPGAEVTQVAHVHRARLNITWFLHLRWAAAAGQLLTIAAVHSGLGIALPLLPLLCVIGLEVLSNLAFEVWVRREVHRGHWPRTYHRAERALGLVVASDILLLTLLLGLTGGPANPFCIFYLINVVLAAVVLDARWAWGITALSVGCYALLFRHHIPLPPLDAWHRLTAGEPLSDDALHSIGLYRRGLLVAVVGAALCIAWFTVRVSAAARVLEHEVDQARQRHARGERLEALGTLAAGAAHELASPLSTISVVTAELAREMARHDASPEEMEDIVLIQSEVARCRAILDQMSLDVGQSRSHALERVTLARVLEEAAADLEGAEHIEQDLGFDPAGVELVVPRRALALALRGVIKNSLDASPAGEAPHITGRVSAAVVELVVSDRGEGMPAHVLSRATEPFFTTKEPGSGMGLGLFLTRTVIERLDGALEFETAPGQGTRVRVRLPRGGLSRGGPGSTRSGPPAS